MPELEVVAVAVAAVGDLIVKGIAAAEVGDLIGKGIAAAVVGVGMDWVVETETGTEIAVAVAAVEE